MPLVGLIFVRVFKPRRQPKQVAIDCSLSCLAAQPLSRSAALILILILFLALVLVLFRALVLVPLHCQNATRTSERAKESANEQQFKRRLFEVRPTALADWLAERRGLPGRRKEEVNLRGGLTTWRSQLTSFALVHAPDEAQIPSDSLFT